MDQTERQISCVEREIVVNNTGVEKVRAVQVKRKKIEKLTKKIDNHR